MRCSAEDHRLASVSLRARTFTFNGLTDCHAVIATWLMPEGAFGAGRQRAEEERSFNELRIGSRA